MPYDPNRHHRRSIRLRQYDYSTAGAYFITICVEHRLCLFGDVINGEMVLNDAGRMIDHWWQEIELAFVPVELDEYIVMPNHFHGIVIIPDASVGQTHRFVPTSGDAPSVGADLCVRPDVPRILQWFKTMTTNSYIRGVKEAAWEPFHKRLWQRNYYEHIIRHNNEMDQTREYVAYNAAGWDEDQEHPAKWRE